MLRTPAVLDPEPDKRIKGDESPHLRCHRVVEEQAQRRNRSRVLGAAPPTTPSSMERIARVGYFSTNFRKDSLPGPSQANGDAPA